MRPIVTSLACLVLASQFPGPARAEIHLPKKTIVVQDFSRKRQDLLDTLKVNLPGAKVEIKQFRGAEVVLEVIWNAREEIPSSEREEAVVQLERHCDGLIRRSYPGMYLSRDSLFQVRSPTEQPLSRSRLSQLRNMRLQMPALPRGPTPEEKALENERQGMAQMFTANPEALLQKVLDRKLAEAKPVSEGSGQQPDEFDQMVPGEGTAEPPEEQPIMLQRLQGSGEVSPQTIQEVQDFHRRRGLPGSSLNTVRGIYAAIHAARQLDENGSPAAAPEAEAESSPDAASLPAYRPRTPASLDQELEALFASPREDSGSRLGLSMVSFPAPDPSH